MEKKMEATVMGYVGTTIRIHSFIPSQPKVSFVNLGTGILHSDNNVVVS